MITFYPSTLFLDDTKEVEAEPAPILSVEQTTGQVAGQVTGQVSGQDKILEFCKQPRTAKEIMKFLGLKHRESFYKNHLKPLLQKKLLLMTIPSKPQSKNQKYFTPI